MGADTHRYTHTCTLLTWKYMERAGGLGILLCGGRALGSHMFQGVWGCKTPPTGISLSRIEPSQVDGGRRCEQSKLRISPAVLVGCCHRGQSLSWNYTWCTCPQCSAPGGRGAGLVCPLAQWCTSAWYPPGGRAGRMVKRKGRARLGAHCSPGHRPGSHHPVELLNEPGIHPPPFL